MKPRDLRRPGVPLPEHRGAVATLTDRQRARAVAKLRNRIAWWEGQGKDATHLRAELAAVTGEDSPTIAVEGVPA